MRRNNYFDYFFRERHSTEVIALRVGADALVSPAEQARLTLHDSKLQWFDPLPRLDAIAHLRHPLYKFVIPSQTVS
jgi:hypothetical protein